MSADNNAQDKPKKGKGMVVKAGAALLLLGAGGGSAFAYLSPGLLPGSKHEAGKNEPRLLLKGETDPYPLPVKAGEEAGGSDVSGEGGSKYRTAYYTFSEEFTSNLRNSVGLIQLSLAASTHYDGRVLMWLKKHELAVRSRILVVLADTPEEEVFTPEGKEQLRKRIAGAINEVLTEAEGFGGVDQVHFRSLLVQ